MNNSLITWRVLTMTLRGKVEQRHSLKGWCLKLPPNVSVARSFRGMVTAAVMSYFFCLEGQGSELSLLVALSLRKFPSTSAFLEP